MSKKRPAPPPQTSRMHTLSEMPMTHPAVRDMPTPMKGTLQSNAQRMPVVTTKGRKPKRSR